LPIALRGRQDVGRIDHSAVGDSLKNLHGDGSVDPDASDPYAEPCTYVGVVATALVAMRITLPHAVEDTHHSAAPPTPHQPCQQCTAATR
jgi:hypothetical protein